MAGRRYLVTGAAGFLGSHLCERLIAAGDSVVGMDNYLTGTPGNVAHLVGSGTLEMVEHDVNEPFSHTVDGIFNLACPASPPWYQLDPVRTVTTNVLGALNCLNLALAQDCRVLQASTSEVYGDPQVSPQSESYWGYVNPVGMRSCYDEGKRVAETLFADYRRQYSVDARIVRIFNTYGPRMSPDDGRVVSNFIVQVLTGEPITIYGDGSHTRSFCYVDDLITGMVRAMEVPDLPDPVNLGNPHEVTILELARRVQRIAGADTGLDFKPLPQDDPLQRRPDIARARAMLDWQPSVGLDEGIAATVRYFRGALHLPR